MSSEHERSGRPTQVTISENEDAIPLSWIIDEYPPKI
jgi:hypothetical protein